ncbi:CubicO group peptidase (beta-lactamase class C family) [Crossiella equi]|uniref:CubicO group peptidase (Beta-lactamase class C family) n=1 Tax=Crossiella equi TaxID=130796 RepID=A0ABS5A6P9_9PSEU|nr:serine hydrolase domain-containing protein [Crossiella equi]MBP2472273.1 CubicO group peptidase (beta-lactamase class C family) [Crossiella equi]
MRIGRYLIAVVVAMAGVVPATAVADPGLGRRMDEALARAAAQYGDAGVQAVAIRDGKVLWSGHRGSAVTSPATPVTDRTVFAYASLSKLMFAGFVLHQVERGALKLDEPISAYLGEEVAGSRVVTTRMLLTHTAGYPDLYGDPAVAPLFPGGDRYQPDRPYTFAMLNKGIHEPVRPGTHHEYSNTGYLVLGQVLTKVTGGAEAFGRAWRQFVRRAGVTEDHVTLERSPQALRRIAHGYEKQQDCSLRDTFTGASGIPTDLYGLPFTDGAFAGTALGAGLVLDGLFTRGSLLRPDTVRTMTTPTPQSGEARYGMGTSQAQAAGRTWQGHGGTYGGFTSMAATDRARGLTIAVVVNQVAEPHPGETIWQALAKAAS